MKPVVPCRVRYRVHHLTSMKAFALLSLTFLLLFATSATAAGSLTGVWAIGAERNCETGYAWVFLADGYYVEVQLPDKGPSAVGLWRDEGQAIAYTHSHMPFAERHAASELKRLTVVSRNDDRIAALSPRGVERVFHRCPDTALNAPPGAAH